MTSKPSTTTSQRRSRTCSPTIDTPNRAYRLCGIMWAIVHQGHADDIVVLCRRTLQRWPADGSSAATRTVAALATAEYVTGHPDVAAELAEAAIDGERAQQHGVDHVAPLTRSGPTSIGRPRRLPSRRSGQERRSGTHLGMTAMALELDIAAALVTADLGDVDRADRRRRDGARTGGGDLVGDQHQLGADSARLAAAPPRPLGAHEP